MMDDVHAARRGPRRACAVALAGLVALGLPACGGDDPVTDDPSTSRSLDAVEGPLVAARVQVPSSPGDLRLIVTAADSTGAEGIVQEESTGDSVDLDLAVGETARAFDHTLQLVRVNGETAVFRVTAPDGSVLGP